MYVHLKELRYWKSEHGDLTRCQDACSANADAGLFAVTDGAGSTLFPAIWAHTLARHFTAIPLLGDDPFEIEWWVRIAQREYEQIAPDPKNLHDWNARLKAQRQASEATLATLRVSRIDEAALQAELLVFGDSCIIIGNESSIRSFPLQNDADFNRGPICLPSAIRFFNRTFHRPILASESIGIGDTVILSTDAVSRWIVSGGNNRYDQRVCFQNVAQCPVELWPEFIKGCRERNEMIDDDCTALVLTFMPEASEQSVLLNTTTRHSQEVILQRKQQFEQAWQNRNSEMIAIDYGDGKDFEDQLQIAPQDIQHARQVANALKDVLHIMRDSLNTPNFHARVRAAWQQYAPLLQEEPCAESLRQSLQQNGIPLAPVPLHSNVPSPTTQPASSTKAISSPGAPQFRSPDIVPSSPADQEIKKKKDENYNQIAVAIPAPAGQDQRDTQYAVEQLKAALRRNEPEAIIQACLNFLAASDRLEREKMFLFQRVFNREWSFVQMERKFAQACLLDDDETILSLGKQLQTFTGISDSFALTREEQARIEAARERLEALNKARKALRAGNVQEIVRIVNELSQYNLSGPGGLTNEEQELLRYAQQLAIVLQVDDDKMLLAVYELLQQADFRNSFQFTELEAAHIQAAMQRKNWLSDFRSALKLGKPRRIVEAFHPELDKPGYLSAEEQEQLALAWRFVDAWDTKDAEKLVRVWGDIDRSRFRQSFTLTVDEMQQVNRARESIANRPPPPTYVAMVGEDKITLDDFKKMYYITHRYYRFLLAAWRQQQQNAPDIKVHQQLENMIQSLQTRGEPMNLVIFLLDDIIYDRFIQEGIAEESKQPEKAQQFHLAPIDTTLQSFLQFVKMDDPGFLYKYALSEEDIRNGLLIQTRKALIDALINQRWLPDNWLDKRRGKTRIIYGVNNEYGKESSRQKWLLKLLGIN